MTDRAPDRPDWYAATRARLDDEGYRRAPWSDWESWPFEGELVQRELRPPADEPARGGASGIDCFMCEADRTGDPSYVLWRDDVAMVGMPNETGSLPFTTFLMPRRHADLADLTDHEAARLGLLLVAAERAVTDVLDVPRMQVYRFGDGQEHLHWWLVARPTGSRQLRGSFLPLWDDVLPPRDREEVRSELVSFCARLTELAGGELLSG